MMIMIKLIGIALLMLAGANSGAYFSSKVKKHVDKLEAVNDMLRETSVMINFNAVTFKELIEHLQACNSTCRLQFLCVDTADIDIRDNIINAIMQNKDGLNEQEISQLRGFFMQFGTSDLDGQLLMAEKYREYFNIRLQELRQESVKKCRLYNSLGVLGGAFTAVMLI